MLQESKLKTLSELVNSSTKEELIWMSGYLAALAGSGTAVAPVAAEKKVTNKKVNLVFGTETGNSKKLATQLAAVAKKRGVNAKLTAIDQYKINDLPKEEYLFMVISTQGEGEPPNTAKKFYDHIHSNELSLANLKYSVLALGDTSYPMYCKTGEDVDMRFHQSGATRIVPLQKCDVDYEADAQQWFEQVLRSLEDQPATEPVAAVKPAKTTGKKYYNGAIQASINLNDRGSNKETFHIEIATEEDISYEPGDAIGIVPFNRQHVVERILELTGINGSLAIETTKVTAPVSELLTQHLNICYLLSATIQKYAALTGHEIPDTRMDLVDLLRIYPVKDATQFAEAIKLLLPIAPRLYSISSSPAAHGTNEVHITVAKDRFLAEEEQRFGLCSEFLGDQPVNSPITFYVSRNKSFKLPAPEKDIIMVGPGTGIAAFRSFIAERDANGAEGRNWLFFGEQHFTTDFLYQTELQNYAGLGSLNRIDVAFSRDQQEKIYVQHRMKEKGADLYDWLQNGASLYVCGAKEPMSRDVENTLLQIISEQGNKTVEEAKEFLEKLEEENRYEKDVY